MLGFKYNASLMVYLMATYRCEYWSMNTLCYKSLNEHYKISKEKTNKSISHDYHERTTVYITLTTNVQ